MARQSLALYTAGTDPLAITDIVTHGRLNSGEEAYVLGLIRSAAAYYERRTNRQLTTATYDLYLDEFEDEIDIPRPPLQSVTSIKYYDSNGVLQTLAATVYEVDTSCEPGRVRLGYNQVWPTTQFKKNAVVIRFIAGYGATPDSVPMLLRQGMMMLASHWYENRETVNVGNIVNELNHASEAIINLYKVPNCY